MKRTRKWSYVAQEAQRLSGLGLSKRDIAERLGVNRSTVSRWINAGKLPDREEKPAEAAQSAVNGRQTPAEWAASVRAEYALDATDDQLVTMAEAVLLKARDEAVGISARLNAMGRFQALVKQLALVARKADAKPQTPQVEEKKKPALRVVKSTGTDPRTRLMAVAK